MVGSAIASGTSQAVSHAQQVFGTVSRQIDSASGLTQQTVQGYQQTEDDHVQLLDGINPDAATGNLLFTNHIGTVTNPATGSGTQGVPKATPFTLSNHLWQPRSDPFRLDSGRPEQSHPGPHSDEYRWRTSRPPSLMR